MTKSVYGWLELGELPKEVRGLTHRQHMWTGTRSARTIKGTNCRGNLASPARNYVYTYIQYDHWRLHRYVLPLSLGFEDFTRLWALAGCRCCGLGCLLQHHHRVSFVLTRYTYIPIRPPRIALMMTAKTQWLDRRKRIRPRSRDPSSTLLIARYFFGGCMLGVNRA